MANEQDSDFMQYLARSGLKPEEPLPSIQILAKTLGISVGKLREQQLGSAQRQAAKQLAVEAPVLA